MLDDDVTLDEPGLAARRLSLEPQVVDPRHDPRRDPQRRKHLRSDESMESESNPKKVDQTHSAEKGKKEKSKK